MEGFIGNYTKNLIAVGSKQGGGLATGKGNYTKNLIAVGSKLGGSASARAPIIPRTLLR